MKCNECPRKCNVERSEKYGNGFCKSGYFPHVAKVMIHKWEEPCISGTYGAGNIFFSGCNLKCCYCQNHKISLSYSSSNDTNVYTPEMMQEIMLEIAEGDAHNINFVTPDCYFNFLSEVITDKIKKEINKPIILNCSGYNLLESIEKMRGKADIFMPDFKYAKSQVAKKYSNAEDYPIVAEKAIRKMFEIAGPCRFDEKGLLKSGVIVRHLILPSNLQNTFDVIDKINEMFEPGEIIFSLMSQYTPCITDGDVLSKYPKLNRKITPYEKKKAETYLFNTDISLAYVQEEGCAEESFIPDFK